MATEREQFIKEIAAGFDEERKILMPENSWLALLARDGRTKAFHQLRYYAKGFATRTNTFRTGFYVEIATADNLQSDILKCSHFSISGVCYSVGDGDVFPPSGERLTWMIYGTFVKDVYTPEV